MMQSQSFLERVKKREFFKNQVMHVRGIEPRAPVFGELTKGVHPSVDWALKAQKITRLYSHQAEAIEKVRAGRHVVVVTGTASGKTLCYDIPAIEALLADSRSTMLFVYPTKALAQDQLRGLARFESPDITFLAGTYDGDTPANLRRKLRDGGQIVLTNPDMLHQGILPQHARWNRFFTHLKYVVIDEVHAYRGVFGSHLANVIRRLSRVCRHYGSQPQFICSSATIGNPKEHAERICGREMELVTNDGSPRGPKQFVLWNPPPLETAALGREDEWRVGGDRRSPLWEAVHLMTALVREGVQTITFTRTRLAAELIFKNSRDLLRHVSPKLAESVHAYRGGYLPEERREIERKLAAKEILGVSSTNALELGIDIGSLDACVLVGYPGTIASTWQRAGRAGRGRDESLVFLVADNSPIDQFLMMHSGYLFAQNPEQAVVDPDNPHIAVGHLKCAAQELPVADAEVESFGAYAGAILDLLEEQHAVRHIEGRWYWASSEYPAAQVSLRNIAGPVYTIQDDSAGGKVIGTMDEVSALSQLHDHAVYLHAAETYFVTKLDLEQKIAHVDKKDLDYYTQAVTASQIRVDETEEERDWAEGGTASGTSGTGFQPVSIHKREHGQDARATDGPATLAFGDVTVTTSIPMFKKIKFHSRDSLGFEKLELPPQSLETVALWFVPPERAVAELQRRGMVVGEALIGIANALVEVAPLYVMCDVQDIGTVVDSSCLGKDALFLYDRYPGGMGYARRCLDRMPEIMQAIYEVICHCACKDGCPSCVGAAIPAFALTDLDSSVRGRIPDKAAARLLLECMHHGGTEDTEKKRNAEH